MSSLLGPALWSGAGTLALSALAAAATPADQVVVITAGGKLALEVALHGDAVRISGAPDQPALVGERRGGRGDKRKYQVEGGAAVAEVKLKPDTPGGDPAGFKLRAPDGKLLWKVKIAADKIKISADEDGTRPLVISLAHADKLKVTDGDGHAVGTVKVRAGDRVAVEDAAGHERFTATAGPRSALFGVLLMDPIPPRERWIIMAELLAAGF